METFNKGGKESSQKVNETMREAIKLLVDKDRLSTEEATRIVQDNFSRLNANPNAQITPEALTQR